MSPADKLDYIMSYYKWPILLAVILLLILGSAARRQLTKKEPVIYLALADVVAGEDLENALTAGFLRAEGANPGRQEVYLYRDLYLSDEADVLNHEYAYASRMKLMGARSALRKRLSAESRRVCARQRSDPGTSYGQRSRRLRQCDRVAAECGLLP